MTTHGAARRGGDASASIPPGILSSVVSGRTMRTMHIHVAGIPGVARYNALTTVGASPCSLPPVNGGSFTTATTTTRAARRRESSWIARNKLRGLICGGMRQEDSVCGGAPQSFQHGDSGSIAGGIKLPMFEPDNTGRMG